ncbi:acetyl-CoA carboxylase biotin carboxyl carrier protein subunit [Paramagnetospirillum marisnigri]|uniref:Biotin carboxyl carrier protein of acetyl-CoA carboxylase n=1 Tax=Paramagnetospirillum marisnigri TaxID=1285242 RepID=A0A178MQB0_9PROT|nr:acetyl-CoA carboxylase biotin carboxyl carrier protein subunit [Paramagnetospirillum marisnigri]OAN51094.1 acetyl-CoA carboxylase biotin carboxyl carrier protein subunit [Paramagnetospirillum marisnigri]
MGNKTPTPIDSDLVRTLAALLDETNLTEIEYGVGDVKIRVARTAAPVTVHHGAALAPMGHPTAQPGQTGAAADADHPGAVTSPMVGVAYLSPEPGATKFINPGDMVAEGQTVMLIEAMKTFNPIRAPRSGKVTRILVTDSQPVEFGEPLMIIE